MVLIDNEVKILSDFIAEKAVKEAECFPIDRYFLEPYLQSILKLDRNSFLLYNLERVNPTYTTQLLLCLPELWDDISLKDLNEIINSFSNAFSFYTLILFTYKYVEIDLLEIILNSKVIGEEMKSEIRSYVKSQYPNFIKSEGEIFVIDEELIGVKNEDWMYIKQKLLLYEQLKPACRTLEELEHYISTFKP